MNIVSSLLLIGIYIYQVVMFYMLCLSVFCFLFSSFTLCDLCGKWNCLDVFMQSVVCFIFNLQDLSCFIGWAQLLILSLCWHQVEHLLLSSRQPLQFEDTYVARLPAAPSAWSKHCRCLHNVYSVLDVAVSCGRSNVLGVTRQSSILQMGGSVTMLSADAFITFSGLSLSGHSLLLPSCHSKSCVLYL